MWSVVFFETSNLGKLQPEIVAALAVGRTIFVRALSQTLSLISDSEIKLTFVLIHVCTYLRRLTHTHYRKLTRYSWSPCRNGKIDRIKWICSVPYAL